MSEDTNQKVIQLLGPVTPGSIVVVKDSITLQQAQVMRQQIIAICGHDQFVISPHDVEIISDLTKENQLLKDITFMLATLLPTHSTECNYESSRMQLRRAWLDSNEEVFPRCVQGENK